MSWLNRNGQGIEAIAASITALVAIGALFGVKFQLDENERQQRNVSARASYQSHLALAVANPDFAQPVGGCALLESNRALAYQAFVDHLLYSAEQMLAVEEGWEPVFLEHLVTHKDILCSANVLGGDTLALDNLLTEFKTTVCLKTPSCE
ncbi:MAG: hypothetical protein ACI861_000608 [Paracoccaceae bacterium]|jgi:hypothetical protein